MTQDETLLDGLTDESTRRSVLKTGALATAGAGLAGVTSGSGFAQQTDDGGGDGGGTDQNWMRGLVSVEQFRPDARFVVTSPQLDWDPTINGIRDEVWSDFNTRVIRYMNSNEQVLFWPRQEAEFPSYDTQRGYVIDGEGYTGPNNTLMPEIYRMNAQYAPFGNSGYVGVRFTAIGEEEQSSWADRQEWLNGGESDPAGPGDFQVSLPYGNETGNETSGVPTGSPTETESGNATDGS